jgi:hypothetical protein
VTIDGSVVVSIDLPSEFLSDILITAFDGSYGGCWYWATPAMDGWLVTDDTRDELGHRLWWSVYVAEREDNSGNQWLVTRGTVLLGIQRAIEDAYPGVADAVIGKDAGDIDAELADIIVQYGVFGKLVYG